MEYVIPAILVILLIGGFVTFMVLNATKKSGAAAKGDDAPGIGPDETPLGDTTEHAGDQSAEGHTKSDPEDPASSGTGRQRIDPDATAHTARPGEGEGAERLDFEGEHPRPASERLADRDI